MSRPEKPRRKRLTPLAEVLDAALAEMGIGSKVTEASVRRAWESCAPNSFRENLRFLKFRDGVAEFASNSSTWTQALRLSQVEVRERMNRFLGKPIVKELRVGGTGKRRREKVK